MYKILVMNMGGTSTKVALYGDLTLIAEQTIRHSQEEIARNPLNKDQVVLRADAIRNWLESAGYRVEDLSAFAVRASSFDAVYGGTYLDNPYFRKQILKVYNPDEVLLHGARITIPVVERLMGDCAIPIYVTDPYTVNELSPEARVLGVKGFERHPRYHAMNQKAIARQWATEHGKKYAECRLIVAHLGAGISVGVHLGGKIVEVNDSTEGFGAMSPQRAGTVPTGVMLSICYDMGLDKESARRMVRGEGGVMALLGTDDMRLVEERAKNGDEEADLVFRAMAYQVAKEIGAAAAVLEGNVDAILITGGIAYSERMTGLITRYVKAFAPVAVYPGEVESFALASGAYRVLSGEEEAILLEEGGAVRGV